MIGKAAKQEAFEEAARLKNQYRGLDDDEADFLDSVLEATRRKEAEVRKDTLEQLDAFRRRQDEAERKLLEDAPEPVREEEAHWVNQSRKRKKGPELLKGVKLRKASSATDDAAQLQKGAVSESTTHSSVPVAPAPKPAPSMSASALTPGQPFALDLGYTSSDEDT